MHDSSAEDQFLTPRTLHGDGDGVRRHAEARRVPTPSCRKFCARAPRDQRARAELEEAVQGLREREEERKRVKAKLMQKTGCAAVQRARTVAEITPTKVKVKRRAVIPPADVATLHATPRPLDAAPPSAGAATAPRPCRRPDAWCRAYGRLVLLAWRRQRGRLEESAAKGERCQNQISQLEVQVDFLKTMRNSECEKRDEALNECQLLRRKNEVYEAENSQLIQELKIIKEELANAKKNFKLAKCDLKKSSEHMSKLQDQLRRKKEEKLDLLSKVSAHEQEISSQMATIIYLKEKLKITEMNLQNSEVNLKNKQDALDEMIQHLRAEVEMNGSLKEAAAASREAESELENRSRHLEESLEESASRCRQLAAANASAARELHDASQELNEERQKWYRNAGEFAAFSMAALKKIAEAAFLPHDYRRY